MLLQADVSSDDAVSVLCELVLQPLVSSTRGRTFSCAWKLALLMPKWYAFYYGSIMLCWCISLQRCCFGINALLFNIISYYHT